MAEVQNLVPCRARQMRLKTAPFERNPPESKTLVSAAPAFRNRPAEPFLDQGPKRRAFLPRYPAGLPEKAISNLYGCLHMATHIIASGEMSRCSSLAAEPAIAAGRCPNLLPDTVTNYFGRKFSMTHTWGCGRVFPEE